MMFIITNWPLFLPSLINISKHTGKETYQLKLRVSL